ncbi:MAG: exodeoxyribonuclease III [Candidatus Omnitrophota bacterium]
MKIISWNVNGIRAVQKKGFLDWFREESPDILCLQETKAHPDQLDMELLAVPGYQVYWSWSEVKKGYSGVATYTKSKPSKVARGFGKPKFDQEGRILLTEYPAFILLNIYFPNGKSGPERLQYKLDFYEETLKFTHRLRKEGQEVVVCGDYNTAHQPIDLARPKENEDVSGFLPVERAWMDRWVVSGQVDIFRKFHPEPERYTWWDMKSGARARNVGWRIDYHFVSAKLAGKARDAYHLPEVIGSDHCPVVVDLA